MTNTFELGIGVVLLCVGLVAGIRKNFSLGLSPGRAGGSAHPLFTITITGIRAIIFALVTLVSSLTVILVWLHYNPVQGASMDDRGIIGFVALSSIVISILCFLICAFFEFLYHIEQNVKKR